MNIDVNASIEQIYDQGYCILRGHLPRQDVATIRAAFEPVYRDYVARHRDTPNRGAERHYIPLPFAEPFYQSSIHHDETILAIVSGILGSEMVMTQYATDTPARGSVHQDVHADIGPLFHEDPEMVYPPPLIAVNFSFIDVTPEHGPFEVAAGTHRLPRGEAKAKIEAGEIPLEPLLLNVGDVLVRDPRCLHRGTPNLTDTPRGVAVISFERPWFYREGHLGESPMAAAFYDALSEREKKLLRRIPRG